MTLPRARPLALGAAWWIVVPGAWAQTTASVEVGTTVVEYDGFLVSGAASASPFLQYETPRLSFVTQGHWVIFESGNQIWQGNAALGWLSQPHGPWRAEVSGFMGLSSYQSSGSGYLLARTRLHWHRDRAGVWMSGTTGWTFNENVATPVELAIGAWSVGPRFAFEGSVTSTWLGGGGYLDVMGEARWFGGPVTLSGTLGGRPAASGTEAAVFADASALIALNKRVALSVATGHYPTDPVRGVLAATYASIGFRLHLASRPPPVSALTLLSRARARADNGSRPNAAAPRMELASDGSTLVLYVHAPGADRVAIMGDFTDWTPLTLERVADDTWAFRSPFASGMHRLNVQIDDGPWTVPEGIRSETTDFGGRVAVIVVP